MTTTKRIGAIAATALVASLTGVALQPAPATAADCYAGEKGKVCLNGFGTGDWDSGSFIGVLNGYNFDVSFRVYSSGSYVGESCIGSGDIRWFDRGTSEVRLSIYTLPGGGGTPVPC